MARTGKTRSEFPLLDHVDGLLAGLRKHVPAALEQSDTGAIHQARVSTRRLSAALKLMEPVLSKKHVKSLSKGLKGLRRKFGPLRDADVMIEHLQAISKKNLHTAAVAWLVSRLEADRAALRESARKKTSPERALKKLDAWSAVREEILEAREAVDSLLAESLHAQTTLFAAQSDRLSETDVRVEGAARPNPHDVRITGKALRYTLEMAAVEGHKLGVSLMKTFKQMQESLGTWHDFVVLADVAMRHAIDSEVTHQDAETGLALLDLAKFAVKRSTQELSAFTRLWKRQGSNLTRKIHDAFPLSREAKVGTADAPAEVLPPAEPITAPQTDLDLFSIAAPEVPADAAPAS